MKTVIAAFALLVASGAARAGEFQKHPEACVADIRRNALFVRASVKCETDYMDTPAGLAALAGSKKCLPSMSDRQFTNISEKAMREFDALIRQVGILQACSSVDHIRGCLETGEGCAQ